MLAILRVIKFALQDLVRNISLSIMTVLILVLMLLSVNTLIVVRTVTDNMVADIKDQIDVSVYFYADVEQEEIDEVRTYIESFPEVVSITYMDADEVLADFKEKHSDNDTILSSIDELGDNPLGPTMIIKTRDPGEYDNIITALSVPEYETIIEAKTFTDTQNTIEKIDAVTQHVQEGVLLLALLFATISFFVIFNTIRVAIYTQRTEISIKKLVGATNWFVRGPYILESIFFSLVSVLITGIIVYFSLPLLDPFVAVIVNEQYFLTNYFQSNILLLAGVQFGVVLLLTIVTSGLAMRKYLRV